MVTPEGRVKVLDFGLAKLLEPAHPAVDATALAAPLTEENQIADPGSVLRASDSRHGNKRSWR